MSEVVTGGCLCGAIRYTATGDPIAKLACHCSDCQKQNGTAFSITAVYPDEAVSFTGKLTTYVGKGSSGGEVLRKFCGTCGSPVFSHPSVLKGLTMVKAGTLDDAKSFLPQAHAWVRSKHDWIDIGDAKSYETQPVGK